MQRRSFFKSIIGSTTAITCSEIVTCRSVLEGKESPVINPPVRVNDMTDIDEILRRVASEISRQITHRIFTAKLSMPILVDAYHATGDVAYMYYSTVQFVRHYEVSVPVPQVSKLDIDRVNIYAKAGGNSLADAIIGDINDHGMVFMSRPPDIGIGLGVVYQTVNNVRAIAHYDPRSLMQMLTVDIMYGVPTRHGALMGVKIEKKRL